MNRILTPQLQNGFEEVGTIVRELLEAVGICKVGEFPMCVRFYRCDMSFRL